MTDLVFLGIDVGTSGIRASVIDGDGSELISHSISREPAQPKHGISQQDPAVWVRQLDELLIAVRDKLSLAGSQYRIAAIAIDGTSSTLIACLRDGTACSPAMMYNDIQSQQQADFIADTAPVESAVHGASSSLAKARFLLQKYPQTELFCHQADWLASQLSGRFGISDENNCLKLGYDSITRNWPAWISEIIPSGCLPDVTAPGSFVHRVKDELIQRYQLDRDCMVIAGTTDSNAAVLATGASELGDAVTSLGSTLVIKLFTDAPIFEPAYGIYSHRLQQRWLVGGASNSGGAVLLNYFSRSQIEEMTPQLKPDSPTGLNYYPLPDTGERFPVNDSGKPSVVSPRPDSDVEFFQGLLEGIADIEASGYEKLQELGATKPVRIFTAGGGSNNPAWKRIRQRKTGIEMHQARNEDACYGTAQLARQGFRLENSPR